MPGVECRADPDSIVLIQCEQAGVEGPVMERVQNEYVLRMLGQLGAVTPGQDMCQVQDPVLRDSRDGTGVIKALERGRPEFIADDSVRSLVSPESTTGLWK
jgi:hypothetical protein